MDSTTKKGGHGGSRDEILDHQAQINHMLTILKTTGLGEFTHIRC